MCFRQWRMGNESLIQTAGCRHRWLFVFGIMMNVVPASYEWIYGKRTMVCPTWVEFSAFLFCLRYLKPAFPRWPATFSLATKIIIAFGDIVDSCTYANAGCAFWAYECSVVWNEKKNTQQMANWGRLICRLPTLYMSKAIYFFWLKLVQCRAVSRFSPDKSNNGRPAKIVMVVQLITENQTHFAVQSFSMVASNICIDYTLQQIYSQLTCCHTISILSAVRSSSVIAAHVTWIWVRNRRANFEPASAGGKEKTRL